MSIILTRNFDGEAAEDFTAEVKRRSVVSCKKGSFDFVYVVPTRRRVRELQRELVGEIVFGKLPVYTLELFARELFSELGAGRKMISPSMQGMIVGEILSKDDFKFFRYLSFRPGGRKGVAPAGTIKRIVDQIDYLRENGISPDDYGKTLVAAEESESRKLEEFLRIFEEYEKRLGDKLIDGAGLLSLVNHEIGGAPEFIDRTLPGHLTFFVEGFYNFKKPELEFFKIISSRSNLSFLVKLDCVCNNENLFKMMMGTASDLMARGFDTIDRQSGAHYQEKQNLREYFALNLFAERSSEAKRNLEGKIFVTGVRDTLREVEYVAEKIKKIIKNNPHQKLYRVCVASYLPQDYSQIIREVFAKYRIPANVTDRFTLVSNSVVNAVLSFIDVRLADYERGALLRAITNRFIVLSDDLTPSAAGSILYNAAALCKFERGLKSFREAIARRLELLSKFSPEELDEDEIKIRRDAELLNNAQSILDRVERELTQFNREMLPSEFRGAVRSLLKKLRIYESIAKMDVENVAVDIVERDARAISAFLDVVDEIVDIEMEKGNQRTELDIWMEKLRSALSLARYNVRQKYGYGVYVTSLEEIRGLEFDYMFIVGLNEGELPRKYSPEIFLPLSSQRENREMQPYLQRHLFYQAVSSFEKELYLVHALRTDDIRLVRSSFIEAVLEIADCTSIDDTNSEDHAASVYNIQQAIEAPPDILETIRSENASFLPRNLERCKNADTPRYRNDRDSEFNGRIAGKNSIGLLSGMFAERIFSSAQLESLARCGFQYFARRVLEIAEVPEIETSLSALERGAVLHKILFRFYNELSKRDRLDNAKDELRLLLEIGAHTLDELGIKHDLFEVEREIMLGTPGVKGTLELFLEKVQSKLSGYGFRPGIFELGFGMSGMTPSGKTGRSEIAPVKIGDAFLRGKIDRVDIRTDPSGANELTIFDYKTSVEIPTHKDVVRDKISPQLVLYLSALNQLIGENRLIGIEPTGRASAAGAAFISINRDRLMSADDGKDLIEFIVQADNSGLRYNKTFGGERKLKTTETYPESMEELSEETKSFFNARISEAAEGRFNLTDFSYERVCKFCSYSEACRIALRGAGAEESI
ncbi:MAG TPA: PD-(D/E)XK nuclease family protein [Candidatus Acidoferrales bacterium]|nr:PD-(D/E)XK nuclease family protein [Candidatus Acidoferrales bacterium]